MVALQHVGKDDGVEAVLAALAAAGAVLVRDFLGAATLQAFRDDMEAHASGHRAGSVADSEVVRRFWGAKGAVMGAATSEDDRFSRAKATSWASRKRRAGTFSRQWSMMRRRARGTGRLVPSSSGGSSRRMAAKVSLAVSRAKARLPVSISKSTTPKLKRSARASTASPRTCSGDM